VILAPDNLASPDCGCKRCSSYREATALASTLATKHGLEPSQGELRVKLLRAEDALRRCCELSGADLSGGFPTEPSLPDFAAECVAELRKDLDAKELTWESMER